ncbi:MAG: c-type cytochrome [Deltaproteobacteria bacterium]|nr:c-type cytochrome [Deltaproteobacteria bacterium]
MQHGRGRRALVFILTLSCFVALCLFSISTGRAANRQISGNLPEDGPGLYRFACMACHGADGVGASSDRVGFDIPLPDFTDCGFAPREGNTDWIAVVAEGGPARAFSELMPAFGDALTDSEIEKILNYIRTFCADGAWPRGELNLPRALFTSKAYPEDEAAFTSVFNTEGDGRVLNKIIFEKRFGARNQFEIVVPFGWNELAVSGVDGNTRWESGLGDVAVSVKRVLFAGLNSGAIVSLAGEIILPTGNEDKGLGKGTPVFEPYIAFGRILPADFFFQFQGGGGLSFDSDKTAHKLFWRLAGGRVFYQGHFGRSWSPMIELLGAKELGSDGGTNWDIVPQFQVTLSRRRHVRLNLGARIPLNDADVRETQFALYLLWDWFDGGFFEGW